MTAPSTPSGLQRLAARFADARSHKALGVMPFVTAGYPTLAATGGLLPALDDAGAVAIEIGFPFSDPIADGPVIASSMHEALKAGTRPEAVFEMVARLRPNLRAGLLAMVSQSIVERMGPERFIHDAASAGIDGLIIPDLDLDAAQPAAAAAERHGLAFTLLVAPTTTSARLRRIVATCTGFIYLLARVGITGAQGVIDVEGLKGRVQAVRAVSTLPVAVGFGISDAAQVSAMRGAADAVIVGSALVKRMGEGNDPVGQAARFVQSLVKAAQAG